MLIQAQEITISSRKQCEFKETCKSDIGNKLNHFYVLEKKNKIFSKIVIEDY